jgi:hypothetical protein
MCCAVCSASLVKILFAGLRNVSIIQIKCIVDGCRTCCPLYPRHGAQSNLLRTLSAISSSDVKSNIQGVPSFVPKWRGRWKAEPFALPESSRTNEDDRFALESLGRIQGGDGFVEGRDVADVRPQSSVPHPLDDLTQLGTASALGSRMNGIMSVRKTQERSTESGRATPK